MWGFTGRRHGTDTSGSAYHRERYLAPGVGIWRSKDPVWLDLEPHAYTYVRNTPATHADPSGLTQMFAYVKATWNAYLVQAITWSELLELVLGILIFAVERAVEEADPCLAATGGQRTEPTLPDGAIADEGGVTVDHKYKSGDHPPAHAHVTGGGASTKIGPNGKPLKGQPELTGSQKDVVDAYKSKIRQVLNKVGKWLDYNDY